MDTMIITDTKIDGLQILDAQDGTNIHFDNRGFFCELYGKSNNPFIIRQLSQSVSKTGTIRGIHIQYNPGMRKIVRCIRGIACFSFVDLRLSHQPIFESLTLFGGNSVRLVSVPEWVGVGFEALEDDTTIEYMHSAEFSPQTSMSIRYDDPDIGIIWPSSFSANKIVSERDQKGITYKDWCKLAEIHKLFT
jgi:dTDP-4-dehydrorhamnose 3,5-epimerase